MINTDELKIINYCHLNCEPLKNIMSLPKEEAFALAHELAKKNSGNAFWRFADFENYYPRRIKTDGQLYNSFISLGGKPKIKHPLSFVLQGSDFLDDWFDNGIITKIMLNKIASEDISFTFGDSMANLKKKGDLGIATKEMLIDTITAFEGTLEDFFKMIEEKHKYIEVQLWNEDYCTNMEQTQI